MITELMKIKGIPSTNTKGSRWKVYLGEYTPKTYPFDYANTHEGSLKFIAEDFLKFYCLRFKVSKIHSCGQEYFVSLEG